MDDWRLSSSRVAHFNVRDLLGLSLRVRRWKSPWFFGWIGDWCSVWKLAHGAVLGLHDGSTGGDRYGSFGWFSSIRFSGQEGLADGIPVLGRDGLAVGALFGLIVGPYTGYPVSVQVGTRHGLTVGSSLGIRNGRSHSAPFTPCIVVGALPGVHVGLQLGPQHVQAVDSSIGIRDGFVDGFSVGVGDVSAGILLSSPTRGALRCMHDIFLGVNSGNSSLCSGRIDGRHVAWNLGRCLSWYNGEHFGRRISRLN